MLKTAAIVLVRAIRLTVKRIALSLGSLHLTLMAALGIWLWISPQRFGSSEESTCITQVANLAIVGAHVRFGSPVLRIFSLLLYSLFLIPGLNLLIPVMLFLSLHCSYHKRLGETPLLPHWQRTTPSSPIRPSSSPTRPRASSSQVNAGNSQIPLSSVPGRPAATRALPVCVGLGFLLVVNVIFITDIELTIRRNAHLQVPGESEWGFGQILALLLLYLPLRDAGLVQSFFRRRQDMQTKLNTALKNAIIVENLGEISRWLAAGADPHVRADSEYPLGQLLSPLPA